MSKKVARAIFFILSHNVLRPNRVGGIIGLALAAVCSFGAGEAAAQYCPQTLTPPLGVAGGSVPGFFVEGDGPLRLIRTIATLDIPTVQVSCPFPRTTNRDIPIGVRNPRIFTDWDDEPGIYASHAGSGQLGIWVHALDPQGRPIHPDPLDYATHAVRTRGNVDYPSFTGEFSHGVHADHTGEGRVGIDFRDLSLSTTGNNAYGIYVSQSGGGSIFEDGKARLKRGAMIINVIETDRDRASRVRPMIATRGDQADVIRAQYTRGSQGHIAVTVEGYLIAAGGIVPTDTTALRPGYSEIVTCLFNPQNDGISCDPNAQLRVPGGVVAFFSGVTSEGSRGIYAVHDGLGDVRIRTTDSIIMTWGDESQGIYGTHTGRPLSVPAVGGGTIDTPAGGAVSIDVTGGSIVTRGQASYGVWGRHRGRGVGEVDIVDIDLRDASVATEGLYAHGVFGLVQRCLNRPGVPSNQCDLGRRTDIPIEGSGVGNIAIDVRGGSIVTAGGAAYAVHARHENEGDIAIRLTGGATAVTRGDGSHGVFANHRGSEGDVAVTLEAASVITEGNVVGEEGSLIGVFASRTGGTGDVAVTVGPGSTVETMGSRSTGVFGTHTGTGNLAVDVRGGSVTTTGDDAIGVGGSHTGSGNVVIDVGERSTIAATGQGVSGTHTGTGNLEINVRGGSVTTTATDTDTRRLAIAGVYGTHFGTGNLAINVQDGSVTAMDDVTHGIYARILNEDDVAVAVTVGQDAVVRGGRNGVLFFVDETEGTPTTGGTGAGVRSAGLDAVAGTGSPVIRAHGGRHFRLTNRGEITGGAGAGVQLLDRMGRIENHGMIAGRIGIQAGAGGGSEVVNTGMIHSTGGSGIQVGTGSEVTNTGMIRSTAGPGIQGGGGSDVTNTGMIHSTGGSGIQVGPGSEVVNSGTIAGTIPIRAGGGSEVTSSGTIRSTDGGDGTLIRFDGGRNRLILRDGSEIVGSRIQGVSDMDDYLELGDVSLSGGGSLIFLDDTGRPKFPVNLTENLMFRSQGGVGRVLRVGAGLLEMDTTTFALTDDVLSDLTGSIHAAVIGSGLQAHTDDGDPARTRVWAAPFGGAREQNGAGWLADGTHYFGGGVLGAGWGTATRVGLFVGGSVGQLDVRAQTVDRRTIDMQTVFGGVYARQDLGDVLLDARVLVGKTDHDSNRRGGIVSGAADVEYTSIFLSPEVGVATRIQLMSRLHATPRLRVRYAGLFTEGFRERAAGGGWDVRFAKRDVHVLETRGEVGIPIALHAGGRIEPRVGIEGRWLAAGDTLDVAAYGGSRVVDVGGDTSVATGTVGVGMVLPVVGATALVGNFDGAYTTEEAWRATGYLGLVYSF